MSHTINEKKLREFVSLVVESDPKYRLDKQIINTVLRLAMDEGAHVPDTLTRIRAMPTVTVVGQQSKVIRPSAARGKSYISIYIKFLPLGGGIEKNLKLLGKKIKSLPGVQTIKFLTVDGREFLIKGMPLVM
jgi:hypothetical protein